MADEPVYLSTDRKPVIVGAKFWDNGLQVVQITEVAVNANPYPCHREGCTQEHVQTWHKTDGGHGGIYDTIDGHLYEIGRLASRYEGLDAESYPAGTKYGDVKASVP